MRGLLVLLALGVFSTAATAQLRTIPKEARLGVMRHLQGMDVEIDGKPQRLAPGAQIRSLQNRIIMPNAIPAGIVVKYVFDSAGQVRNVWIVTEEEAVQR
jgi:hypothetical protein